MRDLRCSGNTQEEIKKKKQKKKDREKVEKIK